MLACNINEMACARLRASWVEWFRIILGAEWVRLGTGWENTCILRDRQWHDDRENCRVRRLEKFYCKLREGMPHGRENKSIKFFVRVTYTQTNKQTNLKHECIIVAGRPISYIDGQDSVNTIQLARRQPWQHITARELAISCNYLNQSPVFCDVILRRWLSGYRRFDPKCHLYLRGFKGHDETRRHVRSKRRQPLTPRRSVTTTQNGIIFDNTPVKKVGTWTIWYLYMRFEWVTITLKSLWRLKLMWAYLKKTQRGSIRKTSPWIPYFGNNCHALCWSFRTHNTVWEKYRHFCVKHADTYSNH